MKSKNSYGTDIVTKSRFSAQGYRVPWREEFFGYVLEIICRNCTNFEALNTTAIKTDKMPMLNCINLDDCRVNWLDAYANNTVYAPQVSIEISELKQQEWAIYDPAMPTEYDVMQDWRANGVCVFT